MSTGLLAILDDVAVIAKIAAASLDDAMTQAAKAGSKAAGIVIDDAAVTPRYVVGFASDRELPIIWKIAKGSVKNKLLYLTPAALLLSAVAPWLIAPLLLLGGVYLCMEGFHKVMDLVRPNNDPIAASTTEPMTPQQLEDEKVKSAIRTDFILSAEIIAITLASIAEDNPPLWLEAAVLVLVGVLMTAIVYGVVGLIVKTDDVGAVMARSTSSVVRVMGRGLVKGMPMFLAALSLVGTLAMLWVGGSIVLHECYVIGKAIDVPQLGFAEKWINGVADAAQSLAPTRVRAAVSWLVNASLDAGAALAIGAVTDGVVRLFRRK
jgi:uncharacterized protein